MNTPIQPTKFRGGRSCWRDYLGLSTIEYTLILILFAVTALSAWNRLGWTERGKVKSSIGHMQRITVDKPDQVQGNDQAPVEKFTEAASRRRQELPP